MKKILFFINTLHGGGAEKVLVDLVNNMNPEKYRITVQTLIDAGAHKNVLKDHIHYKAILKNAKLSKWVIKLMPAKLVYNLFVKDNYDYEVAFLEGYPTRIIAKSTNRNAKKIAWLHTDLFRFPDSENAFTGYFTEKAAYQKFDRIVCVSNSVKESLIEKYDIAGSKISTVYNVVDDEQIRLKADQAEGVIERPDGPLIVSVGRLIAQKGYDRLLRIHKSLMDDGLQHTLWIVGEGEKRPELEAYIQENNLQNVLLLGFQNNPYVYMAKADLFVSSSVAEGFSTVITESVVLGVPVLSTNTAGACEPVEAPRCSVVVETEEELYQSIKRVLTDPSEMKKLKEGLEASKGYFRKEHLMQQIECEIMSWE